MKTYEIKRAGWDNETVRVTVGPDVRVVSNPPHSGGPLNVIFQQEFERYEYQVLAAYSNVESVTLLDDTVKVQVQEYREDEKAREKCEEACDKAKGEFVWVDASKK